MFNTLSNSTRKSDKYGDVHFISFLSATLSRLAYLDDNKFLKSYSEIMGSVIQPIILQAINSVKQDNLSMLLDDQTLFGLNKGATDIFKNYEYPYKGKNYIDFLDYEIIKYKGKHSSFEREFYDLIRGGFLKYIM